LLEETKLSERKNEKQDEIEVITAHTMTKGENVQFIDSVSKEISNN